MEHIKPLLKWLALVVGIMALLVAGVLGYLYSETSFADLPQYAVRFGGEELKYSGYSWQVPVAGKRLARSFEREPSGEVQLLPRMPDSHPVLELPPRTLGSLVIEDEAGQVVFEGDAAEYQNFMFTADGHYIAQLELGEEPDSLGLVVEPHGKYLYRFEFELLAQPILTLSTNSIVQGGVVAIKLTGSLGSTPPSLTTELAPAVFTAQNGAWVSYLPIDYNQPGGEYPITATVNGQTVSASVTVYGRERRELDTYTADGSAAIPYMGQAPKALAPIYEICDPDVYWDGSFTQPVSGKVVRNYAVMEYTDRVDAATLAIYPELAALNETIAPRRSVNVTLAVKPGTKVVAPAAGRVVFAGVIDGGGRTLVIEHGCGLKSVLYLLGKINVNEGEYVAQNDVIGTTQGHVICEMRLYNTPISPWEAWRGQGGLFWK